MGALILTLSFLDSIVQEQFWAQVANRQKLREEILEELPPFLELFLRKLVLIDLKIGKEILEESQRTIKEGSSLALFDQSHLESFVSFTDHFKYLSTKLELHVP